MKQIIIFDDCYTCSEDLQKNVNGWIKEEKPVRIYDIIVNPLKVGYSKIGEEVETTYLWTATVIYEELG